MGNACLPDTRLSSCLFDPHDVGETPFPGALQQCSAILPPSEPDRVMEGEADHGCCQKVAGHQCLEAVLPVRDGLAVPEFRFAGRTGGCFICAPARVNAATVITAPGALPESAEIAKIRLRIFAASRGWPCDEWRSGLIEQSPMTLAVKKPARLAPPAPTIITGLGHELGFSAQSFSFIQRSSAWLSLSAEVLTDP